MRNTSQGPSRPCLCCVLVSSESLHMNPYVQPFSEERDWPGEIPLNIIEFLNLHQERILKQRFSPSWSQNFTVSLNFLLPLCCSLHNPSAERHAGSHQQNKEQVLAPRHASVKSRVLPKNYLPLAVAGRLWSRPGCGQGRSCNPRGSGCPRQADGAQPIDSSSISKPVIRFYSDHTIHSSKLSQGVTCGRRTHIRLGCWSRISSKITLHIIQQIGGISLAVTKLKLIPTNPESHQ